MIIKLLEQPIIALHEAEVVGTVDGVVIKGKEVSHIFHRNMENQFAIPLQNVIIGTDAVMIQEVSALTMASKSIKPLSSMLDVYNMNGRYLGSLTGVEVDKNYYIRYIYTDEYKIEISKAVNYDTVLIVDAEESELLPNDIIQPLKPGYEADMVKLKEEVESSIDCNVVIPLKPVATEAAEAQNQMGEGAEAAEAAEENDGNELQDSSGNTEAISGVDPKYAYLCGKELLESIEINGSFYEKGMLIDANLIRNAIDNNAIVTVIVNAED